MSVTAIVISCIMLAVFVALAAAMVYLYFIQPARAAKRKPEPSDTFVCEATLPTYIGATDEAAYAVLAESGVGATAAGEKAVIAEPAESKNRLAEPEHEKKPKKREALAADKKGNAKQSSVIYIIQLPKS